VADPGPAAHLLQVPALPSTLDAAIPFEIAGAVLRAMAIAPSMRFPNMASAAAALGPMSPTVARAELAPAVLRAEAQLQPATPAPTPARHGLVVALVLAFVVATGGAFALVVVLVSGGVAAFGPDARGADASAPPDSSRATAATRTDVPPSAAPSSAPSPALPSRTPSRPLATSAPPGTSQRCRCFEHAYPGRPPIALCAPEGLFQCTCSYADDMSFPLCKVPWTPPKANDWTSGTCGGGGYYVLRAPVPGAPCKGWLQPDYRAGMPPNGVLADGKVSSCACDQTVAVEPTLVPGVPGAPCQGVRPGSMDLASGTLRCE
jgi:hypothetical protein